MNAPPASASAALKYTCWSGGSIPQYLTKSSDPRKCRGLYKISKSGKYVAVLDNRRVKNFSDLKKRIKQGYTSMQKWCSSNSLTCAVMTSVGVLALQGVWATVKG